MNQTQEDYYVRTFAYDFLNDQSNKVVSTCKYFTQACKKYLQILDFHQCSVEFQQKSNFSPFLLGCLP